MGKKHKSSHHDDDHTPRRHSTDDQSHRHSRNTTSKDKPEVSKSTPTSPKKIETTLDLNDLGAGYTMEDKRISRAVQYYEEILLPFISENYDLFKSTNYLSIKGYGTGLKGNKRRAQNASSDTEDGGAGA